MSSYNEFKSDVKGVASGFLVFLILTLAGQILIALSVLVLMLLILGLYKLFGGNNKQTEEDIKVGSIIAVGIISCIGVIWFMWVFFFSQIPG